MLNILVITLAGDRSALFGISADIDHRLIQRAAVHESRTVEDAIQHITTEWPDVVLVQSSLILRGEDSSKTLRNHLIDRTRSGCTTIFMGFFAHFELQWKPVRTDDVITDLVQHDPDMLRTTNLPPTIQKQALFLGGVPKEQAVYRARQQPECLASVAFARVGSGKVGYIGELRSEADRLVLAMCGLDRSEDAPGQPGQTFPY
jgi:hypothetical protein